ncbi:MAG: DUF1611 domain-containing protein [Oscillospiraceae bacterium]|nr:DUF1611 domain-containing protein [Oscillospiraceae bacterium]
MGEVLECLEKDYPIIETNHDNARPTMPPFRIQKAVVFPCNKEVHSVIRYAKDLTFQLIDVYDVKQTFRVGRSTINILDDVTIPNYIVKNINDIEWNSFDTLVLGCVFELINLLKGIHWLKKLLNEALQRGKCIYAFEEIGELIEIDKYPGKVYYPAVLQENVPPYRGFRLFRTAIPIVGVYGTSSQQGKFTVQMLLRKEFQRMGYSVGQIGTEPSALLFGMDYIFPMGYHSSIHIGENDQMIYANDLLRRLCERNPDIVFVGSQMGTVPSDFGNLIYYCNKSYPFQGGVKPDYGIVMLSLSDDNNYIRRTVDFLRAFTETETLVFVLFPLCSIDSNRETLPHKRRVSADEYSLFKKRVESAFEVPVLFLDSQMLATELAQILLDKFI